MNVTRLLKQVVLPGAAAMLIVGTTPGASVTTMLLLVAFGVEAQVELLVSSQVTTSPSTSVALEYVAEFTPTLLPLSFH